MLRRPIDLQKKSMPLQPNPWRLQKDPGACSQKHDAVVRFFSCASEFRRHVFIFRGRVTLFGRHVGVSEGMPDIPVRQAARISSET
jgi:hypothetical protein